MKQQSRAVQARWAGERASEEEVDEFFSVIQVEKGLALLAKMRKNCEAAGKRLNQRINSPDQEKCKTCGLTYVQLQQKGKPDWFLRRPHRHPDDNNLILVDCFCSAACISLENNKTQGVKGIPDRGMLREDNPKNHKIDLEAMHAKAI